MSTELPPSTNEQEQPREQIGETLPHGDNGRRAPATPPTTTRQPERHLHHKLTKDGTPKMVTTPVAPLPPNLERIWVFTRYEQGEEEGKGTALTTPTRRGTASKDVAAVVAGPAGLGFLRCTFPPPTSKHEQHRQPETTIS